MARAIIIEGLPQFQRRLAAISDLGDARLMMDIGKEYAASAQRLVPVDTGALKDTIGVRSVADREVVIGAGGGLVDYALPVEYGSAPHDIPMLGRQARLKFFWKKKNRWFRGPHVTHPGSRAQPYFTPVTQTINLATRFKAELVAKWNAAG